MPVTPAEIVSKQIGGSNEATEPLLTNVWDTHVLEESKTWDRLAALYRIGL